MSSFRGPKGKVARSLGVAVSQKTQKALDRRNFAPGRSKSSVFVSPTTFPKLSLPRHTRKLTVVKVLQVIT